MTKRLIDAHFTNKDPEVRKIYDAILKTMNKWNDVSEDPKKTSIHLVRKSAFAGVATRKSHLILTFKAEQELSSERIMRREQASARRWYMSVKVDSPAAVDAELKAWLKSSYEIS
jgi:murein L,D-transpeptidase YafK